MTGKKRKIYSLSDKQFNSLTKLFIALTAIILAVAFASCGGGGGGIASFDSDSSGIGGTSRGKKKYHNGGEVGKSGSTLDGIDEIDIKGNPSLDVTGYNYKGATYTDIKSLVKAIYASGTTDDVFYVVLL